MKRFILFIFLLGFVSTGLAHEVGVENTQYIGGLGLITREGPTGMFLNPTSGVQPKGALVPQFCVAVNPLEGQDNHRVSYGFILVYGVLDWLDVGFQGLITEPDSNTNFTSFGAQTRARILKDEGMIPEWSVGAYFREGDDPITSQNIYTALSKGFILHEGVYLNSIRFHLGARHEWHEVLDDRPVGYVGGEIELYPRLHFVGEVVTKDDDVEEHIPYSFGIQVRHPGRFGFSLAGIQPGNNKHLGVYIGVGISFLL